MPSTPPKPPANPNSPLKKLAAAAAFLPVLLAPGTTTAAGPQTGDAFEFEFVAIDGTPMPLSAFRGRVLLIVNTASFCGFTGQYKGLQALWERHEKDGLVVIGVPANDFGAQEPKAEAEIKEFCEGAYGITFPLTMKQTVVGAAAHPFYAWARQTLGDKAAPRWNFHKYVVGRDGRLVAGLSTTIETTSEQLAKLIADELAKPAPAM
jgi:glutathione peroxidase